MSISTLTLPNVVLVFRTPQAMADRASGDTCPSACSPVMWRSLQWSLLVVVAHVAHVAGGRADGHRGRYLLIDVQRDAASSPNGKQGWSGEALFSI